jgi:hypothetical protein
LLNDARDNGGGGGDDAAALLPMLVGRRLPSATE